MSRMRPDERAEEVMRDLATKAPRPVIFARVKLRQQPSRPLDDRCLAQGTIDVSGTLLRAQVSDSNMIVAINTLGHRLERRLRDLRERRESANTRPPSTEDGTWRSGDLPSARPGYFPRPPEERDIVRRKTWAGDRISIPEALFDLHALDHRFFLFTDEVDAVDSIVYETGDSGVRLRRLTGDRPRGTNARTCRSKSSSRRPPRSRPMRPGIDSTRRTGCSCSTGTSRPVAGPSCIDATTATTG